MSVEREGEKDVNVDLEQVAPGEMLEEKRGRPPKYPWEEWMDGQIHKIHIGDDKDEIASKRGMLHGMARYHGMKVITRMNKDGEMVFQFKPKANESE